MFPKRDSLIANLKTKNKSRSKFFRSKFLIYSHQPPTHTWNIEIPNLISAEVKCQGDIYDHIARKGKQTVKVDLKWNLNLKSEGGQFLKGEQVISKDTKISIEQDGREFDWWTDIQKYGPGTLSISTNPKGAGLSLTISYTVVTILGQKGYTGKMSISCGESGMVSKDSKGAKVYSENTRTQDGKNYSKVDVGQKLEVKVSFGECEVKGEDVECSLNVVTKIN